MHDLVAKCDKSALVALYDSSPMEMMFVAAVNSLTSSIGLCPGTIRMASLEGILRRGGGAGGHLHWNR